MIRPFVAALLMGLAASSGLPCIARAADAIGTAQIGTLELSGGFLRGTLPGQPVAGGFLSITNHGGGADVLLGGRADFASRVEVHEMALNGDVMEMRALPDGLVLPAGQTVTLNPGGYHLMFRDLKTALKPGTTAEVVLLFRKAGEVRLTLPVLAPNAMTSAPATARQTEEPPK